MNDGHCELETVVFEAIQGGGWSQELRRHAAGCPVCSDVMLVAAVLQQEAATNDETPLPEADRIWWRAQLHARYEAVERATRAITIFQRIAAGCGVGAGIAGLTWAWPHLARWAASVHLPAPPQLSVPGDFTQPAVVMLASVVALALLFFHERSSSTLAGDEG